MDKMIEYQKQALRADNGNLQYKIIFGLGAAVVMASATNPVVGLAIAVLVFYRSAKSAKSSGHSYESIIKGDCIAHALEGDDFKEYSKEIGYQKTKEEIEEAARKNLPFSKAAWEFYRSIKPRVLPPETPEQKIERKFSSEFKKVELPAEQNVEQKTQEFFFNSTPDIKQQARPTSLLDQIAAPVSNLFVLGVGGSGKGILISNALRKAKQFDPCLKVFVIDPKGNENESGYWSAADLVLKNQIANMTSEEVISWLDNCLDQYQAFVTKQEINGNRVLLIIDELLMLGHYAKEQKYVRIGSLIISVASLGDVSGRKLWLITQTPYVNAVGLNLSQTSQIPWITLVGESNQLRQWGKALSIPPISLEELEKIRQESPVQRAYCFQDKWMPMPKLTNYSDIDRDLKKQSIYVTQKVWENIKNNPIFKSWEQALLNSEVNSVKEFLELNKFDKSIGELLNTYLIPFNIQLSKKFQKTTELINK